MKTLVLLHGWGADSRIWHRQQVVFRLRAHLLAPDFPRWEAAWLAKYLRPLVLSETVVVGWSLGGMLALEAFARWGAHPRTLVLVGVAASFCRRPDFTLGVSPPLVRVMRRRLRSEPEQVVQEFAALCLAPGEEHYRRELSSRMPPPVAGEFLSQGLDYLLNQDLRPWLARLDGAVTIVHGGQDRVTSVAQAHFLKTQIPGARLEVLKSAGHLPFLTQAEKFNALLGNFL